jgi:Uma2 family endonuclease
MIYQSDPPLPPKQTLPTMYDLPSEDAEEPGLPDTYHYIQAEFLNHTFCPGNYPSEQVFSAIDLNLYYDVHHPNWYKRPDWFGCVGVDRLYEQKDLRLSYVVWQEGVNPFIVVELLSPGTEKEDLGQTLRDVQQPPTKWAVYEQILRIPYYVVFDRYQDILRIFQLNGGRYQQLNLNQPRLWLEEIGIGIGLWQGSYQGIERLWLRWYDPQGNWIPTPEEITEQERQRAEQERQRAEQERQRAEQERQRAEQERQRVAALIEQLRSLGVEPDL